MPTIWTEGPLSSKSSVSNAPSSKLLIQGHSTSAPVLSIDQCTQVLDSSWWGPGPSIHAEVILLILVSSTAVSKPVLLLPAHLPWRRKILKSSRMEAQSVMTHIIKYF